jgi:hypothetical protein
MGTEESSDMESIPAHASHEPKYSVTKAVVGLLLVVPWVIIDIVLKQTDPSLVYAWGMFLGTTAGYLLSPGKPKIWVIVVIAALLAVSHFLIVPRYSCTAAVERVS